MFPQKGCIRHFVWLLLGLLAAQVRADTSSENNSGIHDPPIVTPNFYDPNYHDDGRNHLRGPTAASSSSTISVMSPYAAASSTSSDAHGKPGGGSGGTIMAIVDHFYGPNGEEQVKYTNPNQMDKEEFDAILASLSGNNGGGSPASSKPAYNSPSTKHIQYSTTSSSKVPPKPAKYVGAPLSTLYKSSSSPSYSTSVPSAGYTLPALYKSAGSETSYSKPSTSYRPATYSTIYKDPQYASTKPRANHYSKGSSEYRPTSLSYSNPKDPILLHSPKEPTYLKSTPYYDSPHTGPKSISDAILSDGYPKGYPPIRGTVSNVIDHEDNFPYALSPSYPPPPSYMSLSPAYQPTREYSSGSPYAPPTSLKAGLHSLPVKYSGSHGTEYGMPGTPAMHPMHHDSYSSGFGGGYSIEETSDPYSRPSTKGYVKTTLPSPTYSSPPSHSGGHSLSSLYEPLSFDEMYNSPKAKPMYSPVGSVPVGKPGYGPPPSAYALSYGPPVEYHLPPKGVYMTSSSPYGSPGLDGVSPKYKGPYRTVNTGPSGHASSQAFYGYGYGKPHGSHHDEEHSKANNDDISLAKDVYEDEAKYIRPPPVSQKTPTSPPSSLPPHLLHEYRQREDESLLPVSPPPTGSHESFHPQHLRHISESDRDSYLPTYSPSHQHKKASPTPVHNHHHHPRPYHLPHPNEIAHSPPGPSNPAVESSEEVHHVHVFEKGFFGKEKRLRSKSSPNHDEKWTPVLRAYQFGSNEGGHGSASLERDAHVAVAGTAEDDSYRGRRHRPPPPSRRRPRPYHRKSQEEDDEEQAKMRTPHSQHSHSHHGRRQRS